MQLVIFNVGTVVKQTYIKKSEYVYVTLSLCLCEILK